MLGAVRPSLEESMFIPEPGRNTEIGTKKSLQGDIEAVGQVGRHALKKIEQTSFLLCHSPIV